MILVTEATGNIVRHAVSELLGTSAIISALTRPAFTGLPGGIVGDDPEDNLLSYIPQLNHISRSLHFGLAFNPTHRRIENMDAVDIRGSGGS
jgi:hypothetical protein